MNKVLNNVQNVSFDKLVLQWQNIPQQPNINRHTNPLKKKAFTFYNTKTINS